MKKWFSFYSLTKTFVVYGVLLTFIGGCKKGSTDTVPVNVVPILDNGAVINSNALTATFGCTITKEGGQPVTARGFVWSTSINPTIALATKTNEGAGEGVFNSLIRGLIPGTTYYVKAYATNSLGTAYSNEFSFTTKEPAIGQNDGGGIIFFIDASGKHGLIASPSDLRANWDLGQSLTTNATGTAIGTGQSNTKAIIAAQGAGDYAAKICDDLVQNSYDDWFLPSKDELALIYTNLKVGSLSTFQNNVYWTSTENNNTTAKGQDFANGTSNFGNKTNYTFVRPVRAF